MTDDEILNAAWLASVTVVKVLRSPDMTDTSEQLAPCPFCGGAPTIGFNPRQPADISCENYECPVIVETDVGAFGDAVKIWNTRASTPRQLDAEVVARVQEAMLQQPYIERARNEPAHWLIEVRLSDVKAMLEALSAMEVKS